MLSFRERKTLRELQRRLLVDDPDLERSFRDAPLRRSVGRRWRLSITVVIACVFGVVMLLLGSPASALGIGVVAWLAWHVWLCPDDADHEKP
jgi:Flp pilus assembly protein TadB